MTKREYKVGDRFFCGAGKEPRVVVEAPDEDGRFVVKVGDHKVFTDVEFADANYAEYAPTNPKPLLVEIDGKVCASIVTHDDTGFGIDIEFRRAFPLDKTEEFCDKFKALVETCRRLNEVIK